MSSLENAASGDRSLERPAAGRAASIAAGLVASGSLEVGAHRPQDAHSIAALLRFAQRCGVSASLRALRAEGLDAVRLVTHTDPADQLVALARYCAAHADCNVVGIHLFTFGGVDSAADWMNRYIARGIQT